MPKITKQCDECGSDVERYPSSFTPGKMVFCSTSCRAAGVGKSQKGSKRTLTKREGPLMVQLTCGHCETKFERYHSKVAKDTDRHFCSRECLNAEGARPRRGASKPCAQCGIEFYARPHLDRDRRFCSTKCANASRATLYRGSCAECGAAMDWTVPSRAKTYCSRKCGAQGRSRAAAAERPRRDCATCGTEFVVAAKHPGQRYCSRACIQDTSRREMVTTPCEHCGAGIAHRDSEVRRFCSTKCRTGYRAKNAVGHINDSGYRVISVNGTPRLEHRVVMERMIGRSLTPDETVHHRNGDRCDNRPENLELWANRHPRGQRASDMV